jgi:hypothetical protein
LPNKFPKLRVSARILRDILISNILISSIYCSPILTGIAVQLQTSSRPSTSSTTCYDGMRSSHKHGYRSIRMHSSHSHPSTQRTPNMCCPATTSWKPPTTILSGSEMVVTLTRSLIIIPISTMNSGLIVIGSAIADMLCN